MTSHQSPAEFADLVFERLEGLSNPAPTRAELNELVNVAFYASLEREEGRPIRFAIGFLERAMIEPGGGSSLGGARHWFPIAFREDRPFSAPLVSKLAVNPDGGILAAVRNPEGRLILAGVVGTGANLYRDLRLEPTGGGHVVAGHLLLRVLAPGTIAASCRNLHIATFVRGQVFDRPPVGAFSRHPVARELAASDRVDSRASAGVLERLVRSLLRRGVGGTLVLASSPDIGRDNGYQPSWDSRVLHDAYLNLERALPASPLGTDVDKSLDEHKESPTKPAGERHTFGQQIDRWNFLDDAINFAADLASLDGALVIGPDLAILGFGVKLDSTQPPPFREVRLCLDRDASQSVEFEYGHLGTRHKSALAFAHQHPRTVVVVVSADGVVTLMLRPSASAPLLIWRPVTVESDSAAWSAEVVRPRAPYEY